MVDYAANFSPAVRDDPIFIKHSTAIWEAWGKSAQSFIDVGRALLDAQDDMGDQGVELLDLNGGLPFKKSTAYALMAIARNPALVQHVGKLPGHWGTVAVLAAVPPPLLEAALTDGTIHPGIERSHAIKIKAKLLQSPATTPKAKDAAPRP